MPARFPGESIEDSCAIFFKKVPTKLGLQAISKPA